MNQKYLQGLSSNMEWDLLTLALIKHIYRKSFFPFMPRFRWVTFLSRN